MHHFLVNYSIRMKRTTNVEFCLGVLGLLVRHPLVFLSHSDEMASQLDRLLNTAHQRLDQPRASNTFHAMLIGDEYKSKKAISGDCLL